jgi:hypothetical protein
MLAVPADVSCAVPKIAEPSQWGAVASQNVTVPAVTGVLFWTTLAVMAVAVPAFTVEGETTSAVVLPTGVALALGMPTQEIIMASRTKQLLDWKLKVSERIAAVSCIKTFLRKVVVRGGCHQ